MSTSGHPRPENSIEPSTDPGPGEGSCRDLLESLRTVVDPRKRRGIRHRLVSILALAAAAVVAGARSYVAAGQWAANAPAGVLDALEVRVHPRTGRYVVPCESTIRRTLQACDGDQLDAVLSAWLYPRLDTEQVIVDGKTRRGARAGVPDTVWTGTSRFRTTAEVSEHLPRPTRNQVLPFVLLGGQVWAFHDLADARGPFKEVVDPTSTERLDAASMLKSDDKNLYVWLLNAALRRALLRRGLHHDRHHDRYYFLPDHENVTRRVEARTKTGRHQSTKKVVRQEGERSEHPRDVWWHLGEVSACV